MTESNLESRQQSYLDTDTRYGNSLYVINESDVKRYFRDSSPRPAPVTIQRQGPVYTSQYRRSDNSEKSWEKSVPADLFRHVSFTLSMPVIFSAAADLMMHNKNFSLTKGTLKFYRDTTVGVCKFTGKKTYQAGKSYWNKELKPRAKNALEGWNKPLE